MDLAVVGVPANTFTPGSDDGPHEWTLVEEYAQDGWNMKRQRCNCGAEQRVKASFIPQTSDAPA